MSVSSPAFHLATTSIMPNATPHATTHAREMSQAWPERPSTFVGRTSTLAMRLVRALVIRPIVARKVDATARMLGLPVPPGRDGVWRSQGYTAPKPGTLPVLVGVMPGLVVPGAACTPDLDVRPVEERVTRAA